MSNTASEPAAASDLRSRAASKLTGDSRGALRIATAALGVLHELASSPTTAADALALLHELQVHQVELDLQAEELRGARVELEAALRRQIQLYDAAPVGYLTVDLSGSLLELNLTGAEMLGSERDALLGRPLSGFLAPHSARALFGAMARVSEGHGGALRALQLCRQEEGDSRSLSATISADPAGSAFLIALMDTGADSGPQGTAPGG